MELLKTIRVKAATWVDTNKIVEGILFVADRITFKGADPRINQNGYLLFIVDDSGMQHIIAPDTLEIVGLNENSETAKAVFDVTMKMASAGFTIAETETFWKDCVTSAELMIERKKRVLNSNLKCMLFKLEFQERNEYAQAKSLSHLREEYEKEYGDNEPLLEEMITIISEEEAKKIMLKNMDESTSEECPEFSLWDIAGGDYFAVLATTEWD